MARAKIVSLSFMAALYLCFLQGAAGATFDIQNNCTFTVWAAALPSGGKRLRSGQSWTVQVPTDANRTPSRFWGRTGCSFNSSGRGSCNTGDCGGLLNCKGSGTLATLFEYSLNVGNIDYYDISLVDGFNLPVSIIPSDSSCVRVACSRNITAVCPAKLKVTDGCKSACAAFNAPQYCCTGDYSINCSATNYSKIFKGQCPQAYSYGLDVPSRTFTCPTGTDYKVVFCGGTAATTSSDGNKIGVNYGMGGNNLPPVDQVVTLMNKNNIGKMRIFKANNSTLKALANSGIDVIVGVNNVELEAISSNQDSANAWVIDNIAPFFPATNIKYIAVGNEVLSSSQYGDYLFPAMTNIQTAIQNANLQHSIKVSTTHASDVVNGYPPSQGAFRDDVNGTMRQILKFLSDNGAPLMANVYPYFSYISNTEAISLEYALFKSTSTVLQDGGRSYSNLFDAIVDTFLSAMEASGYPNVSIVITESGWPSAGAVAATVENAQAYNNNLMKHVLSSAGTPKRPGTTFDTYIYSLFNENQKTGAETERHFGLFNANETPAYPFDFLTYQNVPAPPGNLTAPPGSRNSTALPRNSTVSSRNLTGPDGSTNLTALSGNLTRPSGKTSSKILVPVLLGSAGGTALVAVLCLVFSRRIKHWKNCVRSTDTNLAARGDFGQVLFYYKVLRDSTGNFDRKNMLGKGGFGEVYKGRLPDGRVVAVKKLNGKKTSQAAEEFLTEVKLITSVRHRNLVRLLGCCTRGHKRLLVYEFMPNNSLDKHLFGEIRNALSWENRLNIIVGTARGLAYLHGDSNVRIIHRDIKCANILLDDRFHPKIADFGLAKFFPEGQTHVSTRVGGTIGYTAPEYAVHGQLTEKADVYSYGIVVLEIVSGRKCVDARLPAPLQLLLEWAWNQFQQDQVLDIVDSSLQGQYTREEALRVITIALLCTQGSWALRPAMSEVVSMLTNSSEIIAEPTRPAFIDAAADRPANITPIPDSATSAAAPPQRSHGSISVSLHPR